MAESYDNPKELFLNQTYCNSCKTISTWWLISVEEARIPYVVGLSSGFLDNIFSNKELCNHLKKY